MHRTHGFLFNNETICGMQFQCQEGDSVWRHSWERQPINRLMKSPVVGDELPRRRVFGHHGEGLAIVRMDHRFRNSTILRIFFRAIRNDAFYRNPKIS